MIKDIGMDDKSDWSKMLMRTGGVGRGGLKMYDSRNVDDVEYVEIRPGCIITADGIRWFDLRGSGCHSNKPSPPDRKQVETAKCFIAACCKRTSGVCRTYGSYGWKHFAEKWGYANQMQPYVSNGAFIQAAAELGVIVSPIRDSGINVYLSLAWINKSAMRIIQEISRT